MKYLAGFILGVICTSLLFLVYNKSNDKKNIDDNTIEKQVITPSTEENLSNKLPQDFKDFYTRFQADSSYQMEHISFPLEGIPEQTEENMSIENFKWQKKDWTLHGPFNDMDGAVQRQFMVVGEDIVIENIDYVAADYGMQRRFSKGADGEWTLIYYAAINSTQK